MRPESVQGQVPARGLGVSPEFLSLPQECGTQGVDQANKKSPLECSNRLILF